MLIENMLIARDFEIVDNSKKSYNNFALETEIGWNGYVGAGFRMNYLFVDRLSANMGIGLGSWAFKFSGGIRYHVNYPFGFAFGLGMAYNSGWMWDDEKAGDEYVVEYIDSDGKVKSDYLALDLKPVTVLNLTGIYSRPILRSDRIKMYIEAGYAIPLSQPEYVIKRNSDSDPDNDVEFTNETKKSWDKWHKPGSIIFAVGVGIIF